MRNIISTWICLDEVGEESNYSQSGANSSSLEFQAIYWRCVCVFFLFAKRFNPKATLELYTNKIVGDLMVDDIKINEFLTELDVNIVIVPFTYKLPNGYYSHWRNQLYEFNVLQHMAKTNLDDCYLMLDSDCIITKQLDELFERCKEKNCLTYRMLFPEDYIINGITRRQMKVLFEEIENKEIDRVPHYISGEFYMGTAQKTKELIEGFDDVFDMMIKKFEQGEKIKLNEEAHFLSYFYYKHNIEDGTANDYIKQIWNTPYHRNVKKDDWRLGVWHLPDAKKTHFPYILKNRESYMQLTDENLVHSLKVRCLSNDIVGKIVYKTKRTIKNVIG